MAFIDYESVTQPRFCARRVSGWLSITPKFTLGGRRQEEKANSKAIEKTLRKYFHIKGTEKQV